MQKKILQSGIQTSNLWLVSGHSTTQSRAVRQEKICNIFIIMFMTNCSPNILLQCFTQPYFGPHHFKGRIRPLADKNSPDGIRTFNMFWTIQLLSQGPQMSKILTKASITSNLFHHGHSYELCDGQPPAGRGPRRGPTPRRRSLLEAKDES